MILWQSCGLLQGTCSLYTVNSTMVERYGKYQNADNSNLLDILFATATLTDKQLSGRRNCPRQSRPPNKDSGTSDFKQYFELWSYSSVCRPTVRPSPLETDTRFQSTWSRAYKDHPWHHPLAAAHANSGEQRCLPSIEIGLSHGTEACAQRGWASQLHRHGPPVRKLHWFSISNSSW